MSGGRPVAVSLFCEDIREEVTGAVSLSGVSSDNLKVPSFPGALPKLCMYTRVVIPVDAELQSVALELRRSDTGVIFRYDFEEQILRRAISEAKDLGAPVAGLIGSMMAPNFQAAAPIRLQAVTIINGEEITSGVLSIST